MNENEKKAVLQMIEIYCSAKHASKGLICTDCRQLLRYAQERLSNCKYGNDKPTCSKCPIHCYKRDMREKIRLVMRYSGPRMIYKNPKLAVRHLLKSLANKTNY